MPIYEFKCQKCENIFEYLCFKSDSENDADCPSCGSKNVEKLLSTFCSLSSGGTGAGFDGNIPAPSCSSSGGFS